MWWMFDKRKERDLELNRCWRYFPTSFVIQGMEIKPEVESLVRTYGADHGF